MSHLSRYILSTASFYLFFSLAGIPVVFISAVLVRLGWLNITILVKIEIVQFLLNVGQWIGIMTRLYDDSHLELLWTLPRPLAAPRTITLLLS